MGSKSSQQDKKSPVEIYGAKMVHCGKSYFPPWHRSVLVAIDAARPNVAYTLHLSIGPLHSRNDLPSPS